MVDEDERVEDHTPETQKAKLKILQQEFAAEMKKKTEKIKPRLIGCVWVNLTNDDGQAQCPDSCAPVIWDILHIRAMVFSSPVQFATDKSETLAEEHTPVVKSVQKPIELNEEQTKDLIRLVHGSRSSRKFLANEFNAFCKQNNNNFEGFPKLQAKIKRLATWQQCPEEGIMHNKLCWYVPLEIREKYHLKELSMPNKWTFVLDPNQQKSKIIKCLNLEPVKGMIGLFNFQIF
jgi:chromatin assembly factor 1 subunit A